MTKLNKAKLIEMYKVMVRIREFEERVYKEFTSGNIPGFLHLYTGEEAIATGACTAINETDYITSTHRGHGHLLAKGGETSKMMAELFGRKTGYCKGKGGSMHIADADIGVLGANGIVGAGIPIAGGAALAAKLKENDRVAICFLGDGATSTGRFHEGINLAACFNLPVVYVIENNSYAISVPISYSCKLSNLSDKAGAYGIPGITIDGNDVLEVYDTIAAAVERARKGEGPTLVECKTFRWRGHWAGDTQGYMKENELQEWMKNDPIARFRTKLIEMGIFQEKDADLINQEIVAEIDQAVLFAKESPFPAPEEALEDVYAESSSTCSPSSIATPAGDKKVINYLLAINEAVDEELALDPDIFVIGQDLKALGAPRGEFRGMFKKYGPKRIIDAPIAETAMIGGAIGAAAVGMRPIVNIMYANFLGVAGDELLNQLTHMRYMFGGKIKIPMTIMCYSGGGYSGAAQHSKNLYGLLSNITGLKIVVPTTPYDAKGLLKSAIRDDNPVVFLYHQLFMRRSLNGEVPSGDYTVPLGKAAIRREGSDVTVVAIGFMAEKALAAAEKISADGISLEVIDPRTIVPLDVETIANSVKKTGRLIIMDEEPRTGSAASEIAATLGEEVFSSLKSPIERLCGPDTPVPFSPPLEKYWLPDEDKLIKAVKSMVG